MTERGIVPAGRRLICCVISVLAVLATPVVGQGLVDALAPFEPLLGTSWTGRFVSQPAPPGDHSVEWRTILSGQAVQWSKRVEALDFAMETFFYWNAELDAVAFLQLTNRGVVGEGVVAFEGALIALEGVVQQPTGPTEFRQTFELLPDGTLEDRYYRRVGDGWHPEHVIVYQSSSP